MRAFGAGAPLRRGLGFTLMVRGGCGEEGASASASGSVGLDFVFLVGLGDSESDSSSPKESFPLAGTAFRFFFFAAAVPPLVLNPPSVFEPGVPSRDVAFGVAEVDGGWRDPSSAAERSRCSAISARRFLKSSRWTRPTVWVESASSRDVAAIEEAEGAEGVNLEEEGRSVIVREVRVS